jgi:ring-1,2-phenylacetyl-CoA epoxidase subunit PaaE
VQNYSNSLLFGKRTFADFLKLSATHMDFFQLKIKSVIPETADTVTLEFDITPELAPLFQYKQGQYITVRHEADGHELRRSYSMSSSPVENRLAVTVKKVSGGKVSTWLHDTVKEGDTIDVAAPQGRFYNDLNPDKRRTYYLFGAGSGITPLMSIIRTVLESEPMSAIFLLYGSRNEEQIIFRDALDQIAERYNGQLHVEHVLSQPKKEPGSSGIFGMFKKSTTNWKGKTGRIDGRMATYFLDENMPHGPEGDCLYFICGPGGMAEAVKTTLLARDIPTKQVHSEHFVNANHVAGEFDAAGAGGKKVIVHLKGEKFEVAVPDGVTILDVLVKEKYDPPYSCTAGACSTCMAKVISGTVKMDACYALDDEEVKAGYILTCQSHPETAVVELSYDM